MAEQPVIDFVGSIPLPDVDTVFRKLAEKGKPVFEAPARR